MNTGLTGSALWAHGRRLMVLDDGEVAGDLVRDMVEVSTSFCARLHGRRREPGAESGRLRPAGHRPAGGCRCWRAGCAVMSKRVSLGAAGHYGCPAYRFWAQRFWAHPALRSRGKDLENQFD
jgi:hypothetical protein